LALAKPPASTIEARTEATILSFINVLLKSYFTE